MRCCSRRESAAQTTSYAFSLRRSRRWSPRRGRSSRASSRASSSSTRPNGSCPRADDSRNRWGWRRSPKAIANGGAGPFGHAGRPLDPPVVENAGTSSGGLSTSSPTSSSASSRTPPTARNPAEGSYDACRRSRTCRTMNRPPCSRPSTPSSRERNGSYRSRPQTPRLLVSLKGGPPPGRAPPRRAISGERCTDPQAAEPRSG
jgi:hypothetical protein